MYKSTKGYSLRSFMPHDSFKVICIMDVTGCNETCIANVGHEEVAEQYTSTDKRRWDGIASAKRKESAEPDGCVCWEACMLRWETQPRQMRQVYYLSALTHMFNLQLSHRRDCHLRDKGRRFPTFAESIRRLDNIFLGSPRSHIVRDAIVTAASLCL